MTSRSSHTLPYTLRRPGLLLLIAGLTVLLGVACAAARPPAANAKSAPVTAYRGLGTWIDIWDAAQWRNPEAAVAAMQAHKVRTLYLETGNFSRTDAQYANYLKDSKRFITACHARGIRIVAWYLPSLKNVDKDFKRCAQAIDLRTADGQRFDSFALDIEDRSVKSVSERNRRLTALSKRLRAKVGNAYPLGGIIPSPVALEWAPPYWPGFPYKTVAKLYDVIVPMGYYTFHVKGYAATYAETLRNVAIVREKTGDPGVPIHLIGGGANESSDGETTAYVRAVRETGLLGGSLYAFPDTSAADWRQLATVRFNKVQTRALPRDVGYAAPLGNCPGDTSHPKEVFYQAAKQGGQRILHFRLWDVQAKEVRLVVNWQDAGALDAGPKGKWSGVRSMAIPEVMLNAKGRNVIGFVARGDAPHWQRWGVRDVTLVKP